MWTSANLKLNAYDMKWYFTLPNGPSMTITLKKFELDIENDGHEALNSIFARFSLFNLAIIEINSFQWESSKFIVRENVERPS